MKITRKQLRKLIEGTFVADPSGQAAEIPFSVGDSHTTLIKPGDQNSKFWNIAWKYTEEILEHPKGKELLEIIFDPNADFETRYQFLFLFNILEIISDEDMAIIDGEVAASEMISDKQFDSIKSRARIQAKKDYKQSRDYDPKGYDILTNPIEKKKFVDSYKKDFEKNINWYKDFILNILIHGHPHLYTSEDVRRKLYNVFPPGLGDVSKMGPIQYDVVSPMRRRLHKLMIDRALEELQDAGMIKSGVKPDRGYLKLSPDVIKTLSGQMHDKLKKVGASSAAFKKPKPNPNLPALTEAEIRKIVRDALEESESINEKAPPGMEDTVLALKKKFPDDKSAPYAIAWGRYNKKKEKKK
jgi:hypothetical protein